MRRKWKSVVGAFAAAVLATSLLAGCGGGKRSEQETELRETEAQAGQLVGGTLRVRAAKDIGDLNPHTMKSQMYAQNWVYESLVAMKDGEIVPELAESWEVSSDGCTYTFHLREGVRFSDGSQWDSQIARRNLEAVKNHGDAYSFLQSLELLESIKTPDDLTLVLNLAQPCNSLLNDFTFSRPLVMLGEAGFPAEGDPYDNGIASPVGTGMWVLKEYEPEQYALFERNENYWGEKPSFQYLRVEVIPDVNTAASAMKAGEIDLMMDSTQITAELYREMEAAGFMVDAVPTTSVSSVSINTAGEITGDLNVRLALEYATDTEAISQGIYGGLQEPATSYFSPEVPYTDTGIEPYSYDLERANELLEEAGWIWEDGEAARVKEGRPLEIDLIYDSSVTRDRDIGLILQSQYAKAGIQMNIVPQDSQVYRQNWAAGEFGLLIYSSWGGSYEPYATLAAMAADGDKFNTVQKGMSNKEELDRVMLDCLSQRDPVKLQENFRYIMESFHREAVYVPLTVTSKLGICGGQWTGMEMDSSQDSIDVASLKRMGE